MSEERSVCLKKYFWVSITISF